MLAVSTTELCRRLEAYETPRWAIERILDVELTTSCVLDPCAGLGMIGSVCHSRFLEVEEIDIQDWSQTFPSRCIGTPLVADFFEVKRDLTGKTVIMNPPFSRAEEFVSRAQALNARKIICFQRQAWRESQSRRLWWEQNSPARVWVCGARATCWRFDLLDEKGDSGGSSVSMAWYVWERGHKGAEVTSAIYPKDPMGSATTKLSREV